MAKFIEKETDIPVDVRFLPPFRGHQPVAMVTYPSGRAYGMDADLIHRYFDQVPNQVVEVSAVMGGEHDR
jgi:hypothetical protein